MTKSEGLFHRRILFPTIVTSMDLPCRKKSVRSVAKVPAPGRPLPPERAADADVDVDVGGDEASNVDRLSELSLCRQINQTFGNKRTFR